MSMYTVFRAHMRLTVKYSEGSEGLSAVIQLAPGTHHLKFLVDGDMRTADHLPTAVDFTNVLVNYIEVRADEPRAASKPIDIKRVKPQPFPPPGLHPPQVLPPTPTETDDYENDSVSTARPGRTPEEDDEGEHRRQAAGLARPGREARRLRVGQEAGDYDEEAEDDEGEDAERLLEEAMREWTAEIPLYLRDLDAAEGSHSQRRITDAMARMPPPPGLPGFLGKSILNGTTPMKDDSSVLNMPNHTVLNHLATSSIKDNVLATSVTTRYRSKYLTTLIYTPTDAKDV